MVKVTMNDSQKSLSLSEDEEMFLERLWCLREVGKNTEKALIGTHETEQRRALMNHFLSEGWMRTEGDRIEFAGPGEAYAQDVIRRRRLTEVLLYNVLQLNLDTVETSACKIEHIINAEVTDSICTFLGHPSCCPHNKPIPRGSCCQKHEKPDKPLILPLAQMRIGDSAKIVFISSSDRGVLNRLTSLGVYPGTVVRLRQLKPTAILAVGETDIALEPALIDRIYCRRVG